MSLVRTRTAFPIHDTNTHAVARLASLLRALLAACVIAALTPASPSLAAEKDVISFMTRVAHSAISANRNASREEIEDIIRGNVDVRVVGDFSLGSFIEHVSTSEMDAYYDGVINFMARYAAMQSRNYQVESIKFYRPKYKRDNTILVDSKIRISWLGEYPVKWTVSRENGEYKVLDASVYGFSVVRMQRKMFRSYVRENDNDVKALIAVLSQ